MSPSHYKSSDGTLHEIRSMPTPYLQNALRKMEKAANGGPDPVVEALRAEVARRAGGETAARMSAPVETEAKHVLPPADHNKPPETDPEEEQFRERLEEDNEALLGEIALHRMAGTKLPKAVESDDDVAAINAWVVKARELFKRAEDTRKDAKEPYLTRGRWVDSFFAGVKDDVTRLAEQIANRNTPYLAAKKAREEADRRAAEEVARREAEAKAEQERKAAAERLAAEKAKAEAERQMREATDQAARDAAEAAQRDAHRRAQEQAEAEAAARRERQVAEDRADDAAMAGRGKLERTAAGGGASTLEEVWSAEVKDWKVVQDTLGPLGPYFSSQNLMDAVERAAKNERPAIPGVVYVSTVRTVVRKAGK